MSTEPTETRQAFHTNLRIEPSGSGWKATEPDSEQDLYGRGETPPEAVEHYAQLVQGGSE